MTIPTDRPAAFTAFLDLLRNCASLETATKAFNIAWHAGEAAGLELAARMPDRKETR